MCLLETLVCFLWSLGLLALTLRLISNLFYVLCFEIPYEILASMSWFRFEIHFGPPMHVNSLIETWNAVFMDSFCSYPVLCFVTSFCSWNSQIPSPWGKTLTSDFSSSYMKFPRLITCRCIKSQYIQIILFLREHLSTEMYALPTLLLRHIIGL